MKKATLLFCIIALATACEKTIKKEENSNREEATIHDVELSLEQITEPDFNIENIPVSNTNIGTFPFINLPEGLEARKGAIQNKFDVCFFPINGTMTAFEGKLYKADVTAIQGESFSQSYFERSMQDYLKSIGAVKIYDGEITKEEYERYSKQDPNKGGSGDMGYWNQRIQFYMIRTKENGNVFIQFTSDNAGARLNILQEEALKQTITKITADEISKDLTEKGKVVLYINFDIDDAKITADGQEIVKQIAKALQENKNLKVSIEGHTDNSGEALYNKKLSQNRADAVLQKLVSEGIANKRLMSKGFGSEKPLTANDTEENKSKNRRVELIRIN